MFFQGLPSEIEVKYKIAECYTILKLDKDAIAVLDGIPSRQRTPKVATWVVSDALNCDPRVQSGTGFCVMLISHGMISLMCDCLSVVPICFSQTSSPPKLFVLPLLVFCFFNNHLVTLITS